MEGLLNYIKEKEDKYECIVVSDANEFFIQCVTDANPVLTGAFDRVLTNPCRFRDDGSMEIRPCMRDHGNPGNPTCPENMCKTAVLRWFLAEREKCGVTYNTVR